jgi:hypothetical protein
MCSAVEAAFFVAAILVAPGNDGRARGCVRWPPHAIASRGPTSRLALSTGRHLLIRDAKRTPLADRCDRHRRRTARGSDANRAEAGDKRRACRGTCGADLVRRRAARAFADACSRHSVHRHRRHGGLARARGCTQASGSPRRQHSGRVGTIAGESAAASRSLWRGCRYRCGIQCPIRRCGVCARSSTWNHLAASGAAGYVRRTNCHRRVLVDPAKRADLPNSLLSGSSRSNPLGIDRRAHRWLCRRGLCSANFLGRRETASRDPRTLGPCFRFLWPGDNRNSETAKTSCNRLFSGKLVCRCSSPSLC